MYRLDDPRDEAEHAIPWGQIFECAMWAVLALLVLSPVLAAVGLLRLVGPGVTHEISLPSALP